MGFLGALSTVDSLLGRLVGLVNDLVKEINRARGDVANLETELENLEREYQKLRDLVAEIREITDKNRKGRFGPLEELLKDLEIALGRDLQNLNSFQDVEQEQGSQGTMKKVGTATLGRGAAKLHKLINEILERMEQDYKELDLALGVATFQPLHHDIHEQLPGLRYYALDHPSIMEGVLLGFQHYLINLATIVIFTNLTVPLMGGTNDDKTRVLETTLFVSGLSTLLQVSFGSRLPVIQGISFAYLVPILSIINSEELVSIDDPHVRFTHTMRAIQGALIAASLVQIVLGFKGLWRICIYFLSPISMVPTIVLTSLGLFAYGFPEAAKCLEIGFPTVFLVLLFSQYWWHIRVKVHVNHYHIFELFPFLITALVMWFWSYILTATDVYFGETRITRQQSCRTVGREDANTSVPWGARRYPSPLQWGPPTLNASNAYGIMSAVIVSTVESTAAYYAAFRLSGLTPPPPNVISRGIGWGGVGILLSGVFGTAAGSTISIANIGLIGVTRVASRRVIQISAAWMMLLAIFGRFGGVFASIPVPLFAGFLTMLFGTAAAVGISFLHFTNMNKMRNLYIIGFSLYVGFSIPFYFYQYTATTGYGPVHTNTRWFNDVVNVIFSSGAVVALLVGSFLDNTVRTHHVTYKDRGMHWFGRFHDFSKSSLNEEFYSLPYLLHRYFPPS